MSVMSGSCPRFLFLLLRSLGGLFLSVVVLSQSVVFGAVIVTQNVTFDPAAGIADFVVTYSSPPDLFTLDSAGRQADSFQLYIDPNPSEMPANVFAKATTIVRGAEIPVFDEIPIRDRTPESSDPSSGGWGPIRGLVPFTVSGASVSFSVPDNILGVTGDFSYELAGFNYGIQDYTFDGTATVVPEPSSPAFAGVGLLGMLAVWLLRKCKQKSLSEVLS